MPLTLARCTAAIDAAIQNLALPAQPAELYAPVRYALAAGGKRIRPALVLLGSDVFDGDPEKALPLAMAFEIFHNFTLLHDDLMDHAPLRRGKPAVHEKWSPAAAILSGDAMQILAYRQLEELPPDKFPVIFRLFSQTALRVCQGQQYDMDYESLGTVSTEQYLEMIRLKTAVLLGAALAAGATLAGAAPQEAVLLENFGINLGMAFQLQDDLLDVYGEPDFGKKTGGDILSNKKTFLLLSALQNPDPALQDELRRWLAAKPDENKIKAVTQLYNRAGVKAICQEKTDHYHQKALAELDKLFVKKEKKQELMKLSFDLMNRKK